MTLMGCKRDKNKPRKPFKRPHSPVKPRTGSKVGQSMAEADKAFMSQFRGLPSIISGKTRSSILRNDKGEYLPSGGHHILPKSVYPEYRHTKENIAVLTREEHGHVEDHPNEFMEWLKEHRPEVFEWAEKHRHHRKVEKA